jgi:hypothetical protein
VALSTEPEGQAVAQRNLRPCKEELVGLLGRWRVPAIEPGQVGSFGSRDAYTGKVVTHMVHKGIAVGGQVGKHLVEPALPVPIRRKGRRETKDINVRNQPPASFLESRAQLCILDDHKRTIQSGKVVGLARRHECDRPLGHFRRKRRYRKVSVSSDSEVNK